MDSDNSHEWGSFLALIMILMAPQVACGSVLSSLYSGHLAPVLAGLARPGPVVVVVCGGNIVNTQLLALWREETAGDSA